MEQGAGKPCRVCVCGWRAGTVGTAWRVGEATVRFACSCAGRVNNPVDGLGRAPQSLKGASADQVTRASHKVVRPLQFPNRPFYRSTTAAVPQCLKTIQTRALSSCTVRHPSAGTGLGKGFTRRPSTQPHGRRVMLVMGNTMLLAPRDGFVCLFVCFIH
jgi:hypothetical protein